MGQEILYCAKCARRLTTADFEKGLGIRVGPKVSCTDCLQDLVASLTPQEQRDFAKAVAQRQASRSEPKRGSTPQIPIVKPPRASSTSSKGGLLLATAGVGAMLLVIIVLASGRSEKQEPPVVVAPPQAPVESAATRAAREAVERARQASGDIDARIAAWARALPATQGTSYQKEASEMHQGLLDLRKSAHAKEALELDAQTAPLLDREEFVAAGDLIERARRRHDSPEWGALIEARLRTLRARADSLFVSVVQTASEARRNGQTLELKAARDRVARWQRPDLAAELERTLAAALPASAASSERPWRAIFDGKTLEFMTIASRTGWEVQDGAIVMKTPNAINTREEFGDGEIRFRFEARDVDTVLFGVRRVSKEMYRVEWKTRSFRPLEGKICELIFTCKGDAVTAQLNGESVEVLAQGRPAHGCLTFSARAKLFRILSVDARKLP
ncbi:MAG TPA: hypothetical protein VNM14_09310 [Planctomycetota bacterium]|nr:hypothetical protein [Planctomycetota bacterium]